MCIVLPKCPPTPFGSSVDRSEAGWEWRGVEWSGVGEWSGMEWGGAERSGAERSGVEWSGVERSGVEWSGVECRGGWEGVARCFLFYWLSSSQTFLIMTHSSVTKQTYSDLTLN